ncbi:uncharacterized protein [Arachis hypogaea]|uniref:uncharacterized protein isoform X1 n=2 Tax=Arachis TaxID=3817 RepID=UPI000DEC1895|nr:diphthine methyltransferase homolog isoform X1 [Arachis hypogaea]XP_025634421.1 diphthine methyltransferase homolog isoform X1 [Arachis hypogaea]XP_025634422.1 diphthine methyltransferase homolog isoform X1 [Arachis hypogaea]
MCIFEEKLEETTLEKLVDWEYTVDKPHFVMDIAHYYLDGNADAVEFCPHDSYHHVLAASTYNLQEGDRPSRHGSISLFSVDGSDIAGGDDHLDLVCSVETSGIFDIKWSPPGQHSNPFLSQADADGYLRIHVLESSCNGVEGINLKHMISEKISDSMCLYLDWNPSGKSMTVGLSDGSVSIVSFLESKLEIQEEWKAHDFELWTTTFDIHQPNLVYTGSDDCKFSCWDLRDGPSNLVFQNSKAHKMGVCCIQKRSHDPNSLVTGSYDETLRVWDLRTISKPVNETSIGLGGGVWRVKHHPYIPNLVLAACMHNGFAIVSIKGNEAQVLETYKKHDSLAYGADWQKGEANHRVERTKPIVATCSFYDKLVRVWKPENEINL